MLSVSSGRKALLGEARLQWNTKYNSQVIISNLITRLSNPIRIRPKIAGASEMTSDSQIKNRENSLDVT